MSVQKSIVCIIVSLLITCSTSLSAYAAKAEISFIPNSDPLQFSYKIHFGTQSGNYNSEIELISPEVENGQIHSVVDGLQVGQTYYFAITSFNQSSESAYSNEMVYTVPNPEPSGFGIEVGEVQVTSNWQHVNFETPFTDPALVATAVTMNDPEPYTIKIRNLTSTGFDVQIKEWSYLDGNHPTETISYLVMEKGVHQLDQNVQAVAACGNIAELNSFQKFSYANPFQDTPVTIASVVSNNSPDPVTLRLRNIHAGDFQISLQEQESTDGNHSSETFCYVAIDQWSGISNDLLFDVAATDKAIKHTPVNVAFSEQFPQIPFTLGFMQTCYGQDTAVLGMSQLSLDSVSMKIVEEQSKDSEVSHTTEVGGYIAIAPLNSSDNDNDGLSNAAELALGTDPNLADSDNDGLSDGEEYQYWLSTSIAPDADVDGDGLINMLDSDSDNDGLSDGAEVTAGSDPAVKPTDQNEIAMEVGEVVLTHEPVRISFSNSYTHPVIIANAVTRNGGDPSRVCISDIDSTGFTIQIDEFDYLDGSHTGETVTYLVIEKGTYLLDDGSEIEAGLFDTNSTSHIQYSFAGAFSQKPVLLTSIVTCNESDSVIGRIRKITTASFEYKLQEQEANAKSHATETVAYLAWTPGSGTTNGLHFEVGVTPDKVTHETYSIDLGESYSDLPFHFAGMQTTDGDDTAAIKITSVGMSDMKVMVEEEGSKDPELNHTTEVAGYLVILPQ